MHSLQFTHLDALRAAQPAGCLPPYRRRHLYRFRFLFVPAPHSPPSAVPFSVRICVVCLYINNFSHLPGFGSTLSAASSCLLPAHFTCYFFCLFYSPAPHWDCFHCAHFAPAQHCCCLLPSAPACCWVLLVCRAPCCLLRSYHHWVLALVLPLPFLFYRFTAVRFRRSARTAPHHYLLLLDGTFSRTSAGSACCRAIYHMPYALFFPAFARTWFVHAGLRIARACAYMPTFPGSITTCATYGSPAFSFVCLRTH